VNKKAFNSVSIRSASAAKSVIGALPKFAVTMREVGDRFQNMYFYGFECKAIATWSPCQVFFFAASAIFQRSRNSKLQ
jgi:hypothetical protein